MSAKTPTSIAAMHSDLYVPGRYQRHSQGAQVWGRLMSPHPQHPVDKQIAAIGLLYGLTVVTRNINDFRTTGVALFNPFR